jgi:hypothetical protein
MKKIILILCVLALTACGDATDPMACWESVARTYPGSDVAVIPGHNYRFIVRKPNGSIIYVETMSISDTKVTTAFTAFDGK